MDYEKKYKEALEVAQRFYNNSAAITKKGLEDIFPELNESEDEKIRKGLIELVDGIYKGSSTVSAKEERDKYVAWLEKKGENHIVENNEMVKPAWSEEDERMSRFIGNAITADGASEYLESKGIQVIDAHVWLDKLKDRVQLQPKQELSEEDDKEIEEIIELLTKRPFIGAYYLKEHIDFLKSLKDRILPQPKQEWSEEDESILKELVQFIPQHLTSYSYNQYYNWAVSHKPQNTWKPNAGQMEAIRVAAEVGTANDSWAMGVLRDIYNDLKKLKE